jgi:tight adherence protein B
MFSDGVLILAIVALVMLSVGGLVYTAFFASVQSEAQVSRRLEAVTDRQKVATERRAAIDTASRRRSIQSALKDFESRQHEKAKKVNAPSLAVRLEQSGLGWSKRAFFVASLVTALAGFGVGFVAGQTALVSLGIAVILGIGLPNWFVNIMRKRRMARFIDELPNAVDIIVRGIKSGLPLGDCIRIIAIESRDPVRSEFRQIVEAQQLGLPVGEACLKLYERMPVQEANFFGIVISIQQKAGGNLSETLGNLSKVLRERKKMKAKIRAVSQEAKASAAIIGSLPLIVGGLVTLTSPTYIKPLFTTMTGNIMIGGGILMMLVGIFVMRRMINFDI